MDFPYFVIISSLEGGLVENGQWFMRKQIFILRQSTMNLRNFVNYHLSWPFILTQLNPFHLRVPCAKFGWNCPVVLKKKSLNLSIYLCFFVFISLEKDRLNSFELTWISPLTKILFEIGPVVCLVPKRR